MCSGKPSSLLLPLSMAFLHTGLLLKALSRQKPHEKQNKVIPSKGVLEILSFFDVSVVFYFKSFFIYFGVILVKRSG